MKARGIANVVVVFWNNRVLKPIGMKKGMYSILCQFKNCEDNFTWVFITSQLKGEIEKNFGQSWGILEDYGKTNGVGILMLSNTLKKEGIVSGCL